MLKAIRDIRNGMRVFLGGGCAVPQTLVEQLMTRRGELADVEILHLRTEGSAPYTAAECEGNFRHTALGLGPNVREAVTSGRADYTPLPLAGIPRLFKAKSLHVDVALIQVSPPDAHGFCSLGISVDVLPAVLENASVVIAEINRRMPRTMGQGFIHHSKLTEVIETDRPLVEYVSPEPTEAALQIARLMADLVDDGSTVHIPLGPLGVAFARALETKNDLGIHTDILPACVRALWEKGQVTGRKKTLFPGKVVATSAYGDAVFFGFLDNHPGFEFEPSDLLCSQEAIAANYHMTAVESPDLIDLTGQAFARDGGEAYLRGAEPDFLRGAARSAGGRAILALPSRSADGRSTITVAIPDRSAHFTSRFDVEYVATEWGIERLHGRSLRERAVAMIQLAHPEDRDALLEQARERGLVHPHHIKIPKGLRPYPREFERSHVFSGGLRVFFRPIKPMDEDALKELFYSHSEETILQRYFTILRQMPYEQLQRFVTLDYNDRMAIVGFAQVKGRERLICVARYEREEGGGYAEAAFTVHDDFQGRGLGSYLVNYLAEVARKNGITGFRASVLSTNIAMIHVFRSFAPQATFESKGNVCNVQFEFTHPAASGAKAKKTASHKK